MTENEARTAYMAIQQGLSALGPNLEAALGAQLDTLRGTLTTALNSGNTQAFRTVFQQVWNVSLSQVRDVNFLRTLQPYLPSVLGMAGCTWGRIQVCSLAFTGALASEIIIGVLTAALILIVAAIVILILWWLIFKLFPALWNWMPTQKPHPQQTPQWNRLFSALNNPGYGPACVINSGGTAPSEITLNFAA